MTHDPKVIEELGKRLRTKKEALEEVATLQNQIKLVESREIETRAELNFHRRSWQRRYDY
jgi:hypothetical protein